MQLLRVVQPWLIGIDEVGRDAARSPGHVGLGEYTVVVGDAAIADPGLDAIQHDVCTVFACARGHAAHIRSGVGLTECKSGNLVATRHGRQIVRLLLRRTGQGDGTAAQPLHRKRKIGQR